MSSLSLAEAARSLWERRILSSVNLAQDSGTETLWGKKEEEEKVEPYNGDNDESAWTVSR